MRSSLFYLIFLFLFGSVGFSQPLTGEIKQKYDYAYDLYSRGKLSETVSYCSEIIEQGKYMQVFKLRAMAYRSMGNYADAASDYNEALQRVHDPQLYMDRAMVFICEKEFESAGNDLNEAVRLFNERQPSYLKTNFLILEERARVYHFRGDYKSAILDFKSALESGSKMAYIGLLSSLFHSERFYEVKQYSDTLLRRKSENNLLSDSSLYYYVSVLNDISNNAATDKSLSIIERAIANYKNADNRCFQGFYYDLLTTKAYIETRLGQDSLSFEDYRSVYAANNKQPDIQQQIMTLKIKLGIDATPPVITLINPLVNSNGYVSLSSKKTKIEIFGNVKDSSGVATFLVNQVPCKVEDDGTFVSKLELQDGKNEVYITAIDKFDNTIVKKFVIDLQSKGEADDDTAGIPELVSKANYYAILIGENDYQDNKFVDLNNPVKDIKEMQDILQKNYVFDPKNIKILPNSRKTDIIDTIDHISKSLTENDNLLIFFAGHGTIRKDGNSIRGGYLVPVDAKFGSWSTYISSDDIKEAITSSPAKHILFLLDACYGAQLLRSVMDDASIQIKNSYMEDSRNFISSGNNEEVPDKGEFIENLKSYLKTNTQKYLAAETLYVSVKHLTSSTTPIFERISSVGDHGGDFIFIHK